jgi:hypothetical protein
MIYQTSRFMIALVLIFTSACAGAKDPDCSSPDAWPAGMAFTHLKNDGLVDNETIDFKETQVVRLASEKIGKDLYRQVHLVRFVKKSNEQITVITVNEASSQECSMSKVDVYVVSKLLGKYSHD